MTTTDTKQQYEGAILNQLIQNAERLAVVEQDVNLLKTDMAQVKADVSQLKTDVSQLKIDVSQLKIDVSQLKTEMVEVKTELAEVKSFVVGIKAKLDWGIWFLGAIAIGILGNIFSQPLLTALHLN